MADERRPGAPVPDPSGPTLPGAPPPGLGRHGLRQPPPLAFEALAEIAAGPTARVELCRLAAQGPGAGRLVAVKRLHPHIAQDPQFTAMFHDEVWMTAALHHPNVVEVVGWGDDAQGSYLAVELVEGVSLARLMKTVFETREQFTERMVVFVGAELCAGLAAAHALRGTNGEPLRLVHRDLTPGNVLVGFGGQIKIADFGLAKAKQRVSKTLTGVLKGHPHYMAPEYARDVEIDHRADLFSLGVLLFELFTGRYPWAGQTDVETYRKVATEPAPDLRVERPRIDPELANLVGGLLQKDPAARPASAQDVRARLLVWLDTHGYAADNADALGRFVRRNAMRQMRWFERAVAGEFLSELVRSRSNPPPRPSVQALLPGVSRTSPTAASPSRRRARRGTIDETTQVNRPSHLPTPTKGPDSNEWGEEVPTQVQPKFPVMPPPRGNPALPRTHEPFDDDADEQRDTAVKGRHGPPPPPRRTHLEDAEEEELPTRPKRARPDLASYGREPASGDAPSGRATGDAPTLEQLHAEADRLARLSVRLRDDAERAAKVAAQRGVLAQLGAEAAQLASDAVAAARSVGLGQASAMLGEAHRVEATLRRGEAALAADATLGPPAPAPAAAPSPSSVPAPPPSIPAMPTVPPAPLSLPPMPPVPPAPPTPPLPTYHPSPEDRASMPELPPPREGFGQLVSGDVFGVPLPIALGIAFALAVALVILVSMLLG